MIVVDSSAIVAILLDEPERANFRDIVAGEAHCVISAVNVHESGCVLRSRLGPGGETRLWTFLREADVQIVPFDETQARAAIAAFDSFGKGLRAKARLNLADCAAYALAETLNAPLLFKGGDFVHTDVTAAS